MTALSPEALVSRVHAIMTAWELGDTETYRQACAEGVRMTIPAYGLDVRGFAAIWGVRESMKPLAAGPLDLHTVTTAIVDGRSVRARSHVIARATGPVHPARRGALRLRRERSARGLPPGRGVDGPGLKSRHPVVS
jgi:hypothetical protein